MRRKFHRGDGAALRDGCGDGPGQGCDNHDTPNNPEMMSGQTVLSLPNRTCKVGLVAGAYNLARPIATTSRPEIA
jgi:hypothetical protein